MQLLLIKGHRSSLPCGSPYPAALGRSCQSDIPGCREVVIEGENWLLCKPKDAGSPFEATKHFLTLPTAQREQMGKAGRAHMEEVFDKRKVVEMTVKNLF